MAKATITFDLDNREDVMAHKRCSNADEMANIIFELEHNFINNFKHKTEISTDDISDAIIDLLDGFTTQGIVE